MNAGEPLTLGIDLGTQSVKAVLLRADGTIIGHGRAGYALATPEPGAAEQLPAVWWRQTVSAVRDALAEAGIGAGGDGASNRTVVAVACAGQQQGTVCLDARGRSVLPAVTWADANLLFVGPVDGR